MIHQSTGCGHLTEGMWTVQYSHDSTTYVVDYLLVEAGLGDNKLNCFSLLEC